MQVRLGERQPINASDVDPARNFLQVMALTDDFAYQTRLRQIVTGGRGAEDGQPLGDLDILEVIAKR